jgi:hypothetical protein
MNINTLLPRAASEAESIASSPGTLGWVFTFAVAIAAGFLIFDMVKRIRRVRYRDEVRQELTEEQAAIMEATELAKQRNAKN